MVVMVGGSLRERYTLQTSLIRRVLLVVVGGEEEE